jgi:hypothetical protein
VLPLYLAECVVAVFLLLLEKTTGKTCGGGRVAMIKEEEMLHFVWQVVVVVQ